MSQSNPLYSVKAEPLEASLPSSSEIPLAQLASTVKLEPNDILRLYSDQGLNVPSYAQNTNFLPDNKAFLVTSNLSNKTPPIKQEREIQEPVAKAYTVYQNPEEILYNPEASLKEGIGMVKTLRDTLKLELGSKLREEVWDREMNNLRSQTTPKTLIAVCGATGAGKSSILNAILDDNVVPTSGMRACTAVVTELSYHDKPTIDADVSFLSEKEWRDELEVLLHDLVDEDGNMKRMTDLNSDAGVAWSKVHAVYPKINQDDLAKLSVDQIVNYDPRISQILGSTKTISAKDSKTFAKEIGKYIDSKDQKRGKKDKQNKKPKEPSLMDKVRKSAGMSTTKNSSSNTDPNDEDAPALWPLIRLVNVRCKAEALSTGAILVDLPGVADANAARNNIAKDYMKKCNCIWILAPITRAVDDKTARDLLGDAFKIQLMMDGNYDDHAITFIATKCDDISCNEIIRALHLDDHPDLEEIQSRLDTLERETFDVKKEKRRAEKLVKDIENGLEGIRDGLREHEAHRDALENGETFVSAKQEKNSKKRKHLGDGKKASAKRRRTGESDGEDEISEIFDSDSSDNSSDSDCEEKGSDEEVEDGLAAESDEEEDNSKISIEKIEEKINEAKASIKAARERLNEARSARKIASDKLSSLEKTAVKIQREKNAFCSLERSKFSRDVLKRDFRLGLKDLDDGAAEERDPDNFNPNTNLRDYDAIDLPVFTCSSRDYIRLRGQVKGDGQPSCFSNVKDTGIPDLQKWCHQLTIASRERAARSFMTQIKVFAQTVKSYVQGIGDVTAIDRETLRQKWESHGYSEPALRHAAIQPLDGNFGGSDAGLDHGLLHTMNQQPILKAKPNNLHGVTPRLCSDFAQLVDSCVSDLRKNFKDGLEEKCRVGASNAAEAALPTIDEFQSSMHWVTYRATLRRHGSWRRDLNVELVNPFTRNIAHSWSKVFESDLFGPFLENTISAITALVKQVEESAAPGLRDRARLQGDMCLEEAQVALKNAVESVKETMNKEQKEVSRCMSPHVQAQLVEGYDTAMLERGPGSVARQKAYIRGYIDDCKNNIFDDGADILLGSLSNAAEAIGDTLDEAMGKLAQKVEVSLSVLWEGTRDNAAQVKARASIIEVVDSIHQQIKYWTEADKLKQEDEDRVLHEIQDVDDNLMDAED